MFVVDHVGEHDVTDPAVEGGCLAENVDAAQLVGGDPDLRHDVIGAHAERVVDVDDDGIGAGGVESGEALVELCWVELRKVDDLDADIDRAGGVDVA